MRQLSLIFLLACSACSVAGPTVPPTVPAPVAAAAPPSSLPAEMRALVGSAACTEASQCKTVALGARPCGGPEGYLAYSTAVTQPAPLLALAERYAQQQRAANASSGMASTCQFIADPGATCSAGACVLGNKGPDAR